MLARLLRALYADENGFIVSAELILVATITVLSMVVGLSQVSFAVNQELNDVAGGFDAVNQSYNFQGQGNGSDTWFDDGDGNDQAWHRPLGMAHSDGGEGGF